MNDFQEYIKMIESIKMNITKPKLLLHVCCAPCSTSVLEKIREYFEVTLYFYNPNIFPKTEYELRAKALEEYIRTRGYEEKIKLEAYRFEDFDNVSRYKNDEKEGGHRCKGCFALRMRECAKKAKAEGYEYFTTSISVSPHKNSKWINELGRHFEKLYEIKFLIADFKKQNGFKESVELSKTYQVYRQDYCGCIYSKIDRITLPIEVIKVLELLNLNGKGYLVGGSIRDILMNRSPKDFDFSSNIPLQNIIDIFSEYKPKVIGKFFQIVQIHMNTYTFEIARFRHEEGILDGRVPQNIYFVDEIMEDLKRRDFTINAIAYNMEEGIVDPFHGVTDLKKGIIQTVGSSILRFQEDYLRMMRAVRFATELDFEISEETINAITQNSHYIVELSSERIQQELSKILVSKNVKKGLVLLQKSGIFSEIIPEFKECFYFDQKSKHQCFELHEHIFTVVEHTPEILPLRLAALLHDISKPHCQILREDGWAKYPNHANVSAKMSSKILRRLKFSESIVNETLQYIIRHSSWRASSKISIKKTINEIGFNKFENLIKLYRADVFGKSKPHCFNLFDEFDTWVNEFKLEKTPIFLYDLAIDGTDLNDIFCGKGLGDALQKCLEYVWEFPEKNDKKILLEYLKTLNDIE